MKKMSRKRTFTSDEVVMEIMMDSDSEVEGSEDEASDSDDTLSSVNTTDIEFESVEEPSTSISQAGPSRSSSGSRTSTRGRGGRGQRGRQPTTTTPVERWLDPGNDGIVESVPAFSGDTGIKIDLPPPGDVANTPELFFNIFMENMYELFVHETNRYADQVKTALPDFYYLRSWTGTTLQEMRSFLGLMILMGIVDKPAVRLYWSTNVVIETPFFRKVMARDDYLAIMAFFHLANNDEMPQRGEENYDKLYKARPLFDHLNKRFGEVYYPEQNLAVDESMMPWKGRVAFRQFIPSKPIRYGMKIYCICESSSGYICGMKFYTGAETDQREVGHGQNVVKEVADGYLGKGHTLYMDSFFSTVSLFKYLRDNDTTACGTVLKHRKENPSDISKKSYKLRKGEHVVRQQENLIAMRYHDKKDIMLLSTIHDAKKIRTGSTNRRTGEPVKKPAMVHKYNMNMKGVDQVDQQLSYYAFNRKTMKWWKRVATHMIHVAKVQAHLLFQKHNKGHRNTMTQLDFTLVLVKQLTNSIEQQIPRAVQPLECDRLSHRDNPHHIENIPQTGKSANPSKNCFACTLYSGKRKQYIGRKGTRYQCRKCKVPLCVVPCFELYHSHLDYQREVRRHFNDSPDDAGDN